MSIGIRRALYGKLAGASLPLGTVSSGQNIWYQQAPAEAPFPLVILSKSSGVPTAVGFGSAKPSVANPALQSEVWMVKVVDHNTTADVVEAIDARINSLLTDDPLSPAAGTVVQYLRRESDIDFAEEDSGEIYWHCGGLYRVIFSHTS